MEEQEQELRWPACFYRAERTSPSRGHGAETSQGKLPPVQKARQAASQGGQDYQFRYDDGLSARLGVKRIPLIMRQIGRDGKFIFKDPPFPVDKPLRTERKQQQPWWTPVSCPVVRKNPVPTRRHIGVFCDPTRCPPNETILSNFWG